MGEFTGPLMSADFLEGELAKELNKTQEDYDREERREVGEKAIRTTRYDNPIGSVTLRTTPEMADLHEDIETRRLQNQLLNLEKERMELERKLSIARQERETREKIAELEEKKERGKLGEGGSLLLSILRELSEERNKTQEDYDRED